MPSLEESVLGQEDFRATLARLAIEGVVHDLRGVLHDAQTGPVDWGFALTCASALTGSTSEEAQGAALRVVQACLSARDASDEAHTAAAVLLERLGNWPALSLAIDRGLASGEEWEAAPVPLQLDVVRSRIALGIPLSPTQTLAGNRFQRAFWSNAEDATWFSVSAPTSAGKSYIVKRWFQRALVENPKFKGAYIVPTRALIDEVSKDFRDGLPGEVGVFTIPWDGEIGNTPQEIHVVTQERLHLLYERFPAFAADLVFVDEAQKFGDGQRGVLLDRVLAEAVSRNADVQVIFASPLSSNPEILLEGAPAAASTASLISENVTVNQNVVWVDQVRGKPKRWTAQLVDAASTVRVGEVHLVDTPNSELKRLSLVAHALAGDTGGNVVYVNGAADAEKAALQIHGALGPAADRTGDTEIAALRDLVRRTIHRSYALVAALSRGVAFHYGNMPLLVRTEIERLFRTGSIRYLVCTSTLLEGVNLPCRNLFARGPQRGRGRPMSAGDFWNLAGRAGRWGKEFQGNIICVDVAREDKWPEPPRKRVRQPLSRTTDTVLADIPALTEYVRTGEAPDRGASALLEPVFSYLAARAGQGMDLRDLPGLRMARGADVDRLQDAIAEAMKSVELPASVYAKHAGISPVRLQALLDYFRRHEDQEKLLLVSPSDGAAAESYVRALGRSVAHLGAPFGVPGRHWVLAILVVDWMRGMPLAVLISRRIAHYAKQGDNNVAKHIRSTMQDVEQVARFEAPKYLGAYNDVFAVHLNDVGRGDEASELPDVVMMLELGVSRMTEVSLMTLGLSRTSTVALSQYLVPDELSAADCVAWLREVDLSQLDMPELVRDELAEMLATRSSL